MSDRDISRDMLCKAKVVGNGDFITGYYVKLNTDFIVPKGTNFYNINFVPIDRSTFCRFTGVTDCKDKRIFANDIIVAGKWHLERTNEWECREYKEYSGILKVVDKGYYWGLEIIGDLRSEYGFIDGCDECLDELLEEYFIEYIGNTYENVEVAYDFWHEYGDKKIYN